MFTSNIWTEVEIVNGALGVVRDIVYPEKHSKRQQPEVIFIEIMVNLLYAIAKLLINLKINNSL
jgi:hypothetical protein